MNKKDQAQQISLPLYLGKPFLPIKNKIRSPQAKYHFGEIEKHCQALKNLVENGVIQSSEAKFQIKNLVSIIGLDSN